ncbi:MAG: DUF4352 domain-containing protein [Patescibacteria group bacterium]
MPTKKELKEKYWHRVVKVFNYFLIGASFIFILYTFINNGETVLLSVVTALTFALIVHLLFSVIYYRIALYIIYGEEGYIYHWPLKKIIYFLLIVIIFSGVTKFLSYQQPNNDRVFSFLESDQLVFGEDIEIEVTSVEDKGDEISTDDSDYFDFGSSSSTTEGRFVEIDIPLRNIKKEAVSLSWSVGELTDSEGRAYKPYKNPEEKSFLDYKNKEIAPGFSDKKRILYELPTDSEIETIKIKSFNFQDRLIKLN